MESFGTYIDHLILLLAARFQAPLEVSTEELLSPLDATAHDDPWELVARSVQQSLCGPQTPQERLYMHHLDVHHFSALVCRERARYLRWKLSEDRGRRRAAPQAPAVSAATGAAAANAKPQTGTFDVTRDSLQRDVSALYALVRQSLPSTLGNDDEEEDDEEEGDDASVTAANGKAAVPHSTNGATPSPISAHVHDVFVRTAAERHRDEQVAHARDEFLSQIQALQTVYYNKYHRWMDAPENVLEPPQPTATTASSSRRSSQSTSGGLAMAAAPLNGARQLARNSEEEERAALLEALGATRGGRPVSHAPSTSAPAPAPTVRTGAHPTVATMRRQVHLQRPLRPSAVPEDALELQHRGSGGLGIGMGKSAPTRVTTAAPTAAVGTSTAAVRGAADGAPVPAAAPAAAAPAAAPVVHAIAATKETAPPASRRGRWQIVEYGDDGDDED